MGYFEINVFRFLDETGDIKLIQKSTRCSAGNQLTFEGIPLGIGRLLNLEVLMAAWNRLECIPEGVCRCLKLKKLILHSNCLITLPEGIHFLANLKDLDVRNNPHLVMPPKPVSQNEADAEFYSIDFSYQTQLRYAAGHSPSAIQISKDPIARKLRLRGRRYQNLTDTDKKLKGMVESAEENKAHHKNPKQIDNEPEGPQYLKGRRWNEALVKPNLNYSDIFASDVCQEPGLTCFQIENFMPVQLDEALLGRFYDGDCYIVIKTAYDDSDQLEWQIFYWIGQHSTLDKKACSAIHAVNLRNLLGAESRTQREEQGDESPEFLELFESPISYIEGGTGSGFFTVDEPPHITKMYRVIGMHGFQMEPVPLDWKSLDPNFAFLCDAGQHVYVWSGKKAPLMTKTKARLLAEKIVRIDRKDKAEIHQMFQGREDDPPFWEIIGEPNGDVIEHEEFNSFKPIRPILYKVYLGMGYLELPQVEIPKKRLTRALLDSKNVYILDTWSEIFIWIGRRSARLVRAAALKLAQELCGMFGRPEIATVSRILEGVETQVFKTKFSGWDDVLAVDFTRTADRVAELRQDETKEDGKSLIAMTPPPKTQKVDLAALFTARQPSMSDTECDTLIEEWNEDLDGMECFVLEGRKFVRLPEDEIGHFYTHDCYVFLCRYWVPVELKEGEEEEEEAEVEEQEDEFQCVVYFWEGRDAGRMGWLTFTFSLQKKFEALFGDKLEVVRTKQQQEALKFLSHFKGKYIIHKGKRKHESTGAELYHIRSTMGKLTRRCIQIECDGIHLNSEFCFILRVPFDNGNGGIVYTWIGNKTVREDLEYAEELGQELWEEGYSVQLVQEGEEPENFFWHGIGGRKDYEKTAEFSRLARLFRCSNEKGFFTVSEKCSDFCQDDLADDDVMMLDTGKELFIWMGPNASDIEKKLALKSAQVYIQHIKEQKLGEPRQLHLTGKLKEPYPFTSCFHGWIEWKQ
eukprot:gene9062-16710_t